MKVRVERADAYCYPDLFVTCAPGDRTETLVKRSPTLVVEVLSESTAAFDRGAKFAHYRQLESLHEYVLIEPERRSVDVFRRNPEGHWVLYAFTDEEELGLASLDCLRAANACRCVKFFVVVVVIENSPSRRDFRARFVATHRRFHAHIALPLAAQQRQ